MPTSSRLRTLATCAVQGYFGSGSPGPFSYSIRWCKSYLSSFATLALLPSVWPTILVSKMTELVLKKIALEKENDYLVLNDAGRIIGRIMIRARSPTGRPWVWTITAREQPPSFSNNQGYSETREQAMKDFKAQYSVLRFIASQQALLQALKLPKQ